MNGKFFEQNLQQIAHANTTINRFLSAFIDHVSGARIMPFKQETKEFFFEPLNVVRRQGLKDLDYIIQEKTIVENILDFEFDTNVSESKCAAPSLRYMRKPNFFLNDSIIYHRRTVRGTFFMDNGHSFDNVLFYGNEMLLFMLELLLFICIIVICGNFLFAILFVAVVHEVRMIRLQQK